MIIQEGFVTGEKPNEEVINNNVVIKRNNFRKIEAPAVGLLPALNGYSFTEKIYSPVEYIKELEQQITNLELAIATIYEGVAE